MKLRAFAVVLACAALTACNTSEEQIASPREPDSHAVGYYCRMTLKEHTGPKGQILPKGSKDPLWFSSVRDALTYVEQDIVSDREFAGFWVNDMAQGTWEKPAPGSWIDARTAWYVVGSSKISAMGGNEAVPFKLRDAADAFAKDNGGHVTDYRAARREIAETPVSGMTSGGGI